MTLTSNAPDEVFARPTEYMAGMPLIVVCRGGPIGTCERPCVNPYTTWLMYVARSPLKRPVLNWALPADPVIVTALAPFCMV